MPNPTPADIRQIFLNPRPHVALLTAAELLGMTLKELKRDIDDGVIVASSTPLGVRIPREEMIAAAMRLFEQTAIEDASATTPRRLCRMRSASSSSALACRAISATFSSRSRKSTGSPSTRC